MDIKIRVMVGWTGKKQKDDWIDIKIDGWMERKNRWMDEKIDGWLDVQKIQMDGWMYRKKQKDGQKEGYKIDGWLDIYKLILIYIQIIFYRNMAGQRKKLWLVDKTIR